MSNENKETIADIVQTSAHRTKAAGESEVK